MSAVKHLREMSISGAMLVITYLWILVHMTPQTHKYVLSRSTRSLRSAGSALMASLLLSILNQAAMFWVNLTKFGIRTRSALHKLEINGISILEVLQQVFAL